MYSAIHRAKKGTLPQGSNARRVIPMTEQYYLRVTGPVCGHRYRRLLLVLG